jgi:hypothetical protein
MRTVSDLRRALIAETSELETPPIELAEVRRRAQRRRFGRTFGALLAALSAVGVAAYAALAATPATKPVPQPTPLPTPSISLQVHPSFPSTGQVIRTGVPVGGPDRELVLRFVGAADHTRLVGGLLERRTGVVRDLEPATSMYDATDRSGGFQELDQIDDRAGGVIDYGLFIGNPARIVAEARGHRYEAGLARWNVNRAFTVFWVDHPGTPLPNPTAYPRPTGPTEQPTFTAYDAAGRQLGSSAGKTSVRTDNSVVIEDTPVVGTVSATAPASSAR